MSRFARLKTLLFSIRMSREFKDPVDGSWYRRLWSLLLPMSYDEWLYWHFDEDNGEVNPLIDDDDYEEDDEREVEERGPPLPGRSKEQRARDHQAAEAAAQEQWQRNKPHRDADDRTLAEVDRRVRDLAALRGIYVLPTPKEKA